MRWHRISQGDERAAARPQNLSRTVQAMRRQRTDTRDGQLRSYLGACNVFNKIVTPRSPPRSRQKDSKTTVSQNGQ
jgi:hypothetical protein